jgi:hypothetical protein
MNREIDILFKQIENYIVDFISKQIVHNLFTPPQGVFVSEANLPNYKLANNEQMISEINF